jgi:hypothetical protein
MGDNEIDLKSEPSDLHSIHHHSQAKRNTNKKEQNPTRGEERWPEQDTMLDRNSATMRIGHQTKAPITNQKRPSPTKSTNHQPKAHIANQKRPSPTKSTHRQPKAPITNQKHPSTHHQTRAPITNQKRPSPTKSAHPPITKHEHRSPTKSAHETVQHHPVACGESVHFSVVKPLHLRRGERYIGLVPVRQPPRSVRSPHLG